ncbi:oxidoreductase [Salimicrobium jeotgali]|uniref:Oxidoreductase n=1 Tax=Salimicrobium jeotgali TaxID=1230341 RepID=K2GRP0_9BACI|nr:SDR family oxidoreductase [Salimicrobium jeotgali]AKG04024.1 oxidoreductase [Salimicrobium jeotgali]EKE33069.1 short-chain dehydrogenase/reductase SDR [Salimicrobium jeotgali]MBM7694936.1 NAD(P)-dependent dehydrogenase (short-subunit alcohol dehydrogenase family) [Salimicrobium jeotgali]
MSKLNGKTAIITGGAGGIGFGIAKAFAKEKANVVLVDVNEETGQKAAEHLKNSGADSLFIHADLTDHAALSSIVDKTVETFGGLDVLVNNAHASKMASFLETTKEDMDLSFNTGFYPTFYLMQAASPHLKKTEGSIINFASGAGINGDANQLSYAAAKEAIRGMTRVAANELGQFGINVNLISPIANSEGVQEWAANNPEYYKKVLGNIPMQRFGDPEEDIGKAAVFLASDDSNYMTGQTLMLDGGSTKLR